LDASVFACPEDIDHFLNWSLGTAARLARRYKLPHYRLPDGSIRFRKDEVEQLVHHVPLRGTCGSVYRDAAIDSEKEVEAPPCA
jgi:hypothetical protein